MGLVVHPELGGAALRPLPPPPRPMLGQGGPHLLGGYVGGLGPMRRPSAGSLARRGRYRHDGSYDGTPRSRSGDDDSPAPPRRLEIAWTFETPPSAGSQRARWLLAEGTHVFWATGGSLVTEAEREALLARTPMGRQ